MSETMTASDVAEQFARFGDVAQMQSILEDELSRLIRRIVRIERISVQHLRYRIRQEPAVQHKSTLLVSYALVLYVDRHAQSQPVELHLQAFLNGRSQKKFSGLGPDRPSPQLDHLLVHLPALDAIAWTMPNDPALPALRNVLDSQKVCHLLPFDSLPPGWDSPEEIQTITAEIARYKPLDRCVVRYTLTLRGNQNDNHQPYVLYGKFFKDDRGQKIHESITTMWQLASRWDDGFNVAQSLGYDATLNAIWLTAIPGTSLTHEDLRTLDLQKSEEIVTKAAHGLAELHKSPLDGKQSTFVDDYLADAKQWCTAIAERFPELADLSQALYKTLQDDRPVADGGAQRPIHGAFRIKQLLLQEATDEKGGTHPLNIGCVDFDGFAIADPLQDVADFGVDILVTGKVPTRSRVLIQRFCDAYSQQVPWPLDRERLLWHIRIQLMRRAFWMRQKRGCYELLQSRTRELLLLEHDEATALMDLFMPTLNDDADTVSVSSSDQVAKVLA